MVKILPLPASALDSLKNDRLPSFFDTLYFDDYSVAVEKLDQTELH